MTGDNSGYTGQWQPFASVFGIDYFVKLLDNTWGCYTTAWGKQQYVHDPLVDPTSAAANCASAMPSNNAYNMLPADMALRWDPNFKAEVENLRADSTGEYNKNEFKTAFEKLITNGVTQNCGGLTITVL